MAPKCRAESLGGKNASLGELFRALKPKGVGVLDGYAPTAPACRRLLRERLDEDGAFLCLPSGPGLCRATNATIIVGGRTAMTEKVSTMDVRARIGDMLNRVALRHDEFIIERKGQPLAALVPVERLEQMRRFARQHARDFLVQQNGGPGQQLSEQEAMDLALEAQECARRRIRRASAGPKRPRRK